MIQLQVQHTSNEIDELKRVKEEFQLEIVDGSELSPLREQFLYDAIALLDLALAKDGEFNDEGNII